MSADPLWYFAYGSNLDHATFVGRRGMRALATRIARLDGYRLTFDLPVGGEERGVANLTNDPDAHVWGVLYLLTPEAFEVLDRTEGVGAGFYERRAVRVVTPGGEVLDAGTYQSVRGRPGRKPSARYMRIVLGGARAHGLPEPWIRQLQRYELAWDERTDRDPERAAEEGPMSKRIVRFYFAYNSPYAFLANSRLARELAPYPVTIDYRPVYSPRTGRGPDPSSPRLRYILEDVARFADAYGITLNRGPFADSRKACLGLFAAQARERGAAFHDGIYRARWLEGRDISADETVVAVAEAVGLDARAVLDEIGRGAHDAALAQSNRDAEADGVFGFPFFVYEGARFWGNDRIEWLLRALHRSAPPS